MKPFLLTLVMGLVMVCSGPVVAESSIRTPVAFAGFAMAGSDSDIDRRYPFSAPLATRFQEKLYEAISTVKPKHYDLYSDRYLDADRGHSVSLALVLEDEKVSIEKFAGVYKVLVKLSAQAIIFDFDKNEHAVIASYPVNLFSYVETYDRQPTNAEIARLVEQYYFGGLPEMGDVISRFTEIAENARINRKFAQEIGIGNVSFEPDVLSQLPEDLASDQPAYVLGLKRRFASKLAAAQDVSIIPSQLDLSISSMAMRFTGERSSTYLTLPKPDYVIAIHIDQIIQHEQHRNAAGATMLYGAFATIRVSENELGGRTVFNQSVRQGVNKIIPSSSEIVDHWAAKEAAISGLFSAISANASEVSKSYRRSQTLTRASNREYRKFGKVLEKCR